MCLYNVKILMYIQYRQHYIKTAKAESKERRFYPADGNQAIPNTLNKMSKATRKWIRKWMKASGLLEVYMTSF